MTPGDQGAGSSSRPSSPGPLDRVRRGHLVKAEQRVKEMVESGPVGGRWILADLQPRRLF